MLNRLEVIGNLGRDPEMTYTPSGSPVTKFSVAVNTRRKGGDTDTMWLNVVAWEKLGEVCSEYLHKGSKVYLAGRLQVREFDRKDGTRGTVVELIASDMVMLDPKGAGSGGGKGDDAPPDDVPF